MEIRLATVLLPLPLQSRYAYLAPENLAPAPQPGVRVLVPFGRNKTYTGVVTDLHALPGPAAKAAYKSIIEVLDDRPVVNERQLEVFQWISWYYVCSEGEVLKAALPAGLNLAQELFAELAPCAELDANRLKDEEYLIVEALQAEPRLSAQVLKEAAGVEAPEQLLRKMARKGYVVLRYEMERGYQQKTLRCLGLADAFASDAGFAEALKKTANAPKQQEALLALKEAADEGKLLPQNTLIKELGVTVAVTNALVKKGIVVATDEPVDRLASLNKRREFAYEKLNDDQQQAFDKLNAHFAVSPGKAALLHGVTGSGKTYVYVELIRKALAEGKQALYLLPEIGLTKQIIEKVKSVFGEQTGVYHSRFSNNERVEIWQKTLTGQYQVVIGVRSAILLPFPRLGLIIVDEEHDNSYKQQEPNPRYNARDVAVYCGAKYKFPVLLGSATPSVETYKNALDGKYYLAELTRRAIAAKLPEIRFIDMTQQVKEKLSFGLLSDDLLDAMRQTLDRGEQIILFNHRRAYAPFVLCENCGFVPHCIYCDVSLSLHKQASTIRCHYCGYSEEAPQQCPVCAHYSFKSQGIGTEQLEEHIAELFPDAGVARMDLDTTRGKQSFQQLIDRFERKEVNILVGTQMVTKGLDFEDATLAVVVNADRLLNFPDFRSHEYAYQLLTQFSGRPGRGGKAGVCLIQTYKPDHPVLRQLGGKYRDFYEREVAAREQPGYPPFTRLVRVELRHKDRLYLEEEGDRFARLMLKAFSGSVLGPEYPPVARLRNHFRLHLLLKFKVGVSGALVRERLNGAVQAYYKAAPKKTLQIIADVDPR